VGRRDPGDLARQAGSEAAALPPGRRSRLGGGGGRRGCGSCVLAPRQRRPVGEACAAWVAGEEEEGAERGRGGSSDGSHETEPLDACAVRRRERGSASAAPPLDMAWAVDCSWAV
jgi:hypothetical protein